MDITPTLGLFFSLFELTGAEKGGWVSLSRILRKSFLQAYTTNYKGFKDKFLRVKNEERYPRLCKLWTGTIAFLIYWLNNPLSVFGFDYDKLNALEIRALSVSNAFR